MKFKNYKEKNKWLVSEINKLLGKRKKVQNRRVKVFEGNLTRLYFGKKSFSLMFCDGSHKELYNFLCGFIQCLKGVIE